MTHTPGTIHHYEDFLDLALRRYWESSSADRASFLALLLATPEAWQVAWDDATKDGLVKPALAGAASVATLAALLRAIASGPLGLLLTGVSVGTLLAVYGREQSSIRRKIGAARELVERYRGEFEGLDRERSRRPVREESWQLMMDGLMQQMLEELAAVTETRQDPASMGGFSEHVGVPSGISPRPPRATS